MRGLFILAAKSKSPPWCGKRRVFVAYLAFISIVNKITSNSSRRPTFFIAHQNPAKRLPGHCSPTSKSQQDREWTCKKNIASQRREQSKRYSSECDGESCLSISLCELLFALARLFASPAARRVCWENIPWLVGCSHLDDLQAGPLSICISPVRCGGRPALPAPDNARSLRPHARLLKNGSTLAVKTSRARVIVYCFCSARLLQQQ